MIRLRGLGLGLAVLTSAAQPGFSASSDEVIEELIVYGRAQQQIGTAQAASQGQVGYDDIRLPPLLRVGELVEAIPGMVATQHSGTGKANQYFLRGFNLDHGTDFSAHLEGVPVNMRTHGHGQGYLDLNFMIPELVQLSRFRKGPYSAQVGDFSSAGSVEFSLYKRLPQTQAQITVGEHGYGRGLIAGSTDLAGGVFTGALAGTAYDGSWDQPEDLKALKFYGHYAFQLASGSGRVTLMGYDGEWNATDQIPERAVASGLISRFGTIDPTLGGQTQRYSLTANLSFDHWDLAAWLIDYDFTLWGNATYFLEQPTTGDQIEQRDGRRIWGARLDGEFDRDIARQLVSFRWGADLRYDDIDEVGLYEATARRRAATLRNDAVEILSLAAYGEAELSLTDRLRAVLGLRGDYFDWDVTAIEPENSGSGHEQTLNPKLTASYRFSERFEGYANWGRGFHTNDVRGATTRIGPDGSPSIPSNVIVDATGAELGLRFERGQSFNATAVLFTLDLDSELLYVGDSASTEPNEGTRRDGVELTAFWQANGWLAVHSEYTFTNARFKAESADGREVPGAVESTFVAGANAQWANGWNASARLRWLGEAPLAEDNSVRSSDSLIVNTGIGWERGALGLQLDVFNLLDEQANDISYFYASRLPAEPAAGVEDLHFHPLEPRTFRATISFSW